MCPKTLFGWGFKTAGRVCLQAFTCRRSEGCTCPLDGCINCDVDVVKPSVYTARQTDLR